MKAFQEISNIAMKIIVDMPFSMKHESVLELLGSHCMLCFLHSSHKSAIALSNTAARKHLYYLGHLLFPFHPCIYGV